MFVVGKSGADPETGRPAFRGWYRQVSRALGLGSRQAGTNDV
jgi:hypothetical protein